MLKIDLKGRIAVVTGATGQLGRTMVRTLGECGADVVICYHKNKIKAVELRKEIMDKYDVEAIIVSVDVTNIESVSKMRDAVLSSLGSPDIIVNNAVSKYKWTTILDQDINDYKDQFESTVIHNVAMIKCFVPAMIEKGYGRIIGINTECAMQCSTNQSAYAAGKRGMDGIFRVLAKEVGSNNITVNQVAPGWTISDAERKNGISGSSKEYASKVPMKRRGTDQEIANAVAFLASDLAGYINGVYLPVCGGNVMPGI